MSSPPASYSTSATRSELVTTVSRGIPSSAAATACVVVPAESATDAPGSSSCTAAAAIACFAAVCRCDLAANPGSSTLLPAAVAPPCTRVTSPRSASASMSRRIVMSETPSRSTSSDTRTPPVVRTSSRITSWRWRASIGSDPFPHDRDRPRTHRDLTVVRRAGQQIGA